MFENIENLKLTFSSCRNRKKHTSPGKDKHVLIFRTSGCGMHTFENQRIESPAGTILFVPAKFAYSFEPVGDEPCSSVSITFSADIAKPQVMLFQPDNFSGMENTAQNIYKQFRLKTAESRYICLSLLYSLFAQLVVIENRPYCDKRKFRLIEPALNYITENLCDPDLKIDTLHDLCGISSAYFRRIFKANMSFTPQKYIEEKRLEHAMSLMEENEFSITEISQMSGYNDPLYFGKVFKNKYGMPPSHMKTKIL